MRRPADEDGPEIDPEFLRSLDEKPAVESAGPSKPPPVVAAATMVEEETPGLIGVGPGELKELVLLGATDTPLFCKTWFPNTFRMPFADFHPEMFRLMDDPSKRFINFQVGRDGAKTTIARAYTGKRIAYGVSRTILYIGASQAKAIASAMWLKKIVSKDPKGKVPTDLATTFGLRKGKKWADDEFEIIHGIDEHVIWVIALGITGSVRGLNYDDYRPDLIIVDDALHDENSATPEQRHKIEKLILGAIKESLSPATETPDAKLILLNTPLDFEDFSVKALKDPEFTSVQYGCWTKETQDLPLEYQESSWPARYPTATLRASKVAAIARNDYSTFAREKEVKLVTPETSAFRGEWLRYFGEGETEPEPPHHEMWIEMAIDPVPPPSDIQIAKGMQGKDFEAFSVVGRWKGKYYVLETLCNRGHDPKWTVAMFFELCSRWKPRKVCVEAVAYQRTLVWLLREAMRQTGRYFMIDPFDDKRKKIDRIKQGLSGVVSNSQLYVRRSQVTLISQLTHYPGKNPEGTFDDEIEAVAVACTSLARGSVGDVPDNHYMAEEENIPKLVEWRGAP